MIKTTARIKPLEAISASTNYDFPSMKGVARCVVHQHRSTASGTGPTLDTKIQESPDGGMTWYDTGSAFTQATGTADNTQRLALTGPFAERLRAVCTLGGSGGPTETFELYVTLEN